MSEREPTTSNTQQTNLIVSGFIHELLLSTSPAPIQTISEIISITLSFINNHHSPHNYKGQYKWQIDQQTVSKLVNLHKTSNKQQITISSPPFAINQIKWQLVALTFNGFIKVSLTPLSIPSKWSKFVVSAMIYCNELSSGDRSIFPFEKQSSYTPRHWRIHFLSMSDIENVTQIEFIIDIQTLRIICDNQLWENPNIIHTTLEPLQSFKWQVSKTLFTQMQQRNDSKCFISEIYHNMWSLRVYPKGIFNPNDVQVELQWLGSPSQLTKFAIQWSIHCEGADIKTEQMNQFGYGCSCAHWGINVLSSEEFKLYTEFTFSVAIKLFPQQPQSHKSISAPILHPQSVPKLQNAVQSVPEMTNNNNITPHVRTFVNNKFVTMAQNVSATLHNLEQKRHMEMLQSYERFNTAIISLQQQMKQKETSHLQRILQQQKDIKQVKDKLAMQQKHITKIYQLIQKTNKRRNVSGKHMSNYNIVMDWLKETVKLPQYIDVFMDNGYDDLARIMEIQKDDLKEIGIDKYGHRKHLMKHIAVLKDNCAMDEGLSDELKVDNHDRVHVDHSQLSYDELTSMRVYKRNSVYVQNIPRMYCNEKILRTSKWFSRFGKIKSIYCNCDNDISSITGTATVDFVKDKDATKAIKYMNGRVMEDGPRSIVLKAKQSSSKYCVFFLRGIRCTNRLCRYVHQWENRDYDRPAAAVQLCDENRWEVLSWMNKQDNGDTQSESEEYDNVQNVETKEEEEKEEKDQVNKKQSETQHSKPIDTNRCSNCGNYNFTSSAKCLLCGTLH